MHDSLPHPRAEETVIRIKQKTIIIPNKNMPERYTSRKLLQLAAEYGWTLVSIKGDHHNYKHPQSRFIVTIVHPQKDVPVGRALDTVKKLKLEIQ